MLSGQYYELPFEMYKLTSLICAHSWVSYANVCTSAFTIVPISSTKAPPGDFCVSLPATHLAQFAQQLVQLGRGVVAQLGFLRRELWGKTLGKGIS
jgi:hypothetical protein